MLNAIITWSLNHRFLVVDKASLEAFLDGSAWDREAA